MPARCSLDRPQGDPPSRGSTKEKTMPKPAEVTLPSDRDVRVTRTFDAPRQLVWDAHTTPDLVRKWQGYDGWDMPVCDMDVRVGGRYKWQWRNLDDGKQFGFFGTFTEVDGPSKLVHDQYYDPGDMDFARLQYDVRVEGSA
jgi:uncharacterized protein YndB with AHSA1/START domain